MLKLERMLAPLALLSLVAVSGVAEAEVGVQFGATARGIYIDENGATTNDVTGSTSSNADGSRSNHLSCFGPTPGSVGCSVVGIPWPLDDWWDRPSVPTLAAGQAYADFGTLQARSAVVGESAGEIEPSPTPGGRYYSAIATAEWREELFNYGSQPTTLIFDFSLDATWNDFGRFALTLGREYFGSEQSAVDGVVYKNCTIGPQCNVGPGEGTLIHVPGDDADNRSGSVNQTISFAYVLGPTPLDEEGAPIPITFLARLSTFAFLDGAEVDAFQTVTLDRIRVQPGADLGFGSGTAWNVEVVPEPATYALWLTALAGVTISRLRRPRSSSQAADLTLSRVARARTDRGERTIESGGRSA